MPGLEGEWKEALQGEFSKPYYKKLYFDLLKEYEEHKVFPPKGLILNAFHKTPLAKVKVCLLGQDPYHNDGQAQGLSFSVPDGFPLPPSLRNIFEELRDDLGISPSRSGDLTPWAEQGVFLLNTVLTVRAHQANSHKNLGWEIFTDEVLRVLDRQDRPMVFLLFGSQAGAKKALLHNPKHCIIEAPHPSPLSAYRGFFGSRPFSRTNRFLEASGLTPIQWDLRR